MGSILRYLHADHLGRPAFATDTYGATIWDGGISTPFGIQVASLGAATQKLMFPGQYADEETGYSDNWHHTYDPTLGRYLQADPIGLAGGLNRCAYVGGNPVGYVDPTGLLLAPIQPGSARTQARSIARNAWRSRNGHILIAAGALIVGAEIREIYNQHTYVFDGTCSSELMQNQRRMCERLLQRIRNIEKNIARRNVDLHRNDGKLPEFMPNPLRNSRRGHRILIRKYEKNLIELIKRFKRECQ